MWLNRFYHFWFQIKGFENYSILPCVPIQMYSHSYELITVLCSLYYNLVHSVHSYVYLDVL